MLDPDELRLLRESLAQVVKAAGPGELRAAVTEFGWHDLLAQDPAAAVSTLATLQGEHLTDTTLLDDMVLAGTDHEPGTAVVLPQLPHHIPTSTVEGPRLHVRGVVSAAASRWVVPALREAKPVVVAVAAPSGADVEPAVGMDPGSGWRSVRTELDLRDVDVLDGPAGEAAWSAMVTAGHRALAHELTAVGSRMLAVAVDHVTTREQFGRKLATFQAVKHLLADVRAYGECAALAADAAWEDGSAESALLAKILAGRFARLAASHGQQVLGGMGFTWEHEFHRLLRRVLVLEPLLGSAAALRPVLGRRIRRGGLPRLAPL